MSKPRVCVLSIDAGGTFLKAALVLHNGTIVKNSFLRVPVDSNGSADHIQNAYTQLAVLGMKKACEHDLSLSAVGVCIPGPFDYDNGISLMTHKYASIRDVPIRPWIREGVGNIPIRFLHDSHAFLLGALWNNCFNEFQQVAGVIIGTGLGFASLINGKIYTNGQGGPGISIFSRPYRDNTSEDYVSRRAIISRYRTLSSDVSEGLDVVDIAHFARQGHPVAISAFSEIGLYLGEILHDIMHDNGFECLLLGGAISKSADLFLPSLKNSLSDLPVLRYIIPAEDIDMAPVYGSARAALFPEDAGMKP